ncbi:hypothetical protein HCX49_12575 [Sphingobacterium kitahiroshimense]|uniref:hypothetical protein n=1 Tax=Sphingobacterium sp. B16(2022) TaxID=2914044 RepID=UPI001438CF2A|nr:hypothetical protein [Sphingobacterium sp. B16(2022)]NJI74038.1 hypothetical protein [Sphingobacterium sp. B16(2022)]
MPWYIYNSGSTGSSCNFTITTTPPTNYPGPKIFLCEIQAADNNQKPILTSELILEIADAVNSRAESANVLLRATQ